MRHFSVVVLAAFAVCSIGICVAFTPLDPVPDAGPDRERRQAFAWMDSLGFPDIKQLTFVRAQVGFTHQRNGEPAAIVKHGFLLEDHGDTFKILDMDMEVSVHERTGPEQPDLVRIHHEPADLLKYTATRTDVGQASGEASQLFLAWVLAQRGFDETSARVYRKASSAAPAFPERAAANLAALKMGRAFEAFRDPRVSRAELLARFEHIVRHFPKSAQHTPLDMRIASSAVTRDGSFIEARAREFVLQLRLMVDEDVAFAARQRQRKPKEKLSDEEQIAELIYRLRDQKSEQEERGTPYYILMTPDSPARQLIDKGYAAVPHLIDALDDKRPTRGWSSTGLTVFTIADCANTILGEISGLTSGGVSQSIYAQALVRNERTADAFTRAVYTAWYADLRKKGEKRWLSEAVTRGDYNSLDQARRLRDRYGEEAVPALAAAARGAAGNDIRRRLPFVELIGSIPGDKATAFLLAEVKEGPFDCQLLAADGLLGRERPEGLAAMIAEWRDENPEHYGKNAAERISRRNYLQLISFLVNCGKPEAIAALAENLGKRPVEQRMDVVYQMSRDTARQAADGDRVWAAMEALLIDRLDDTEERGGHWSFHNADGMLFVSPRVCDVAAHTLSVACPEKYTFSIAAVRAVRERRLAEMKNIWRTANKLPPLPVPEARTFAAVPASLVQPHLETFLVDPVFLADPSDRDKAQAEIEKLGIGAFWPVLDFRDGLTNKEDYNRIDGLAKKLATTITAVEFAAGSLKPDAALLGQFEAVKNKPLDAKTFMQAVETGLKELPAEVHGVYVGALRSGDGAGFTLVIDLLGRERAALRNAPAPVPAVEVEMNNAIVFNLVQIKVPDVPAAKAKEPAISEDAARATALRNAGKNMTDPSKKFYYSSWVRVGAEKNGGGQRLFVGGIGGAGWTIKEANTGFPITYSSIGHFQATASWAAPELQKALDDSLGSMPGEPIEINVYFGRQPQAMVIHAGRSYR
jgi:hypothetical protein